MSCSNYLNIVKLTTMFSLPKGVSQFLDEKTPTMTVSNAEVPPYHLRASRGRVLSFTLLASAIVYSVYSFAHTTDSNAVTSSFSPISFRSWKYHPERDAANYGLSDEQCDAAFPRLFDPINQVIKQIGRPIELSDTMGDIHWGEARAMIYDNEVRHKYRTSRSDG